MIGTRVRTLSMGALGVVLLLAAARGARAEDAPPPTPPPPSAPAQVVPPSSPAADRRVVEWAAPVDPAAPAPASRATAPCAPPPCAPVLPCAPCTPCDEPRRGPLEWRDEFVFAHARLTLTPLSPDTLGCGRSSVHVGFSWANSFGWRQDTTGENPAIRYFLVDGETRTLDVTATRGISKDVDLSLRLPLKWRGAGVLDGFIDAFHESTSGFGIQDNLRKDFYDDKYRVNGLLTDGSPFNADAEKGTGLGDLEAAAKWRFRDGGRDGASFSLVGRVTAPTGTAPFDVGGVNAGLQVVGAQRLGRAFDVFAGVGGTWFGETQYDGITYEQWRGHGFLALEWRPARTWSLIVETDAGTALVSNVQKYDNQQWYLNLGAKIDLGPATRLELGFLENLQSQQTTADFGVVFGIEHRW